MSSICVLPYEEASDEGGTAPPYICVEVKGPARSEEFFCLLDSGASFSAFPLTEAEILGIDESCLEPTHIRTAGGRREALHLRQADLMSVRLGDEYFSLAPYFLPPEVIEDESFESDYYVLGLDLFMHLEVTFRQSAEEVAFSKP